jgi:hypothetical protein
VLPRKRRGGPVEHRAEDAVVVGEENAHAWFRGPFLVVCD